MDINKAKDIVINAGKELVARGLIARTWGNVSQRIDDKSMVITPSGKDYLHLKREDIVLVDIETLEYAGDVKPSSEKGVHASVYKQKKDVNFVIHTHQQNASIISACGVDSIIVDEKYSALKQMVVCAPYGLPSTKKLCKAIAGVLPGVEGRAIVMKHHGALCFGKDYDETFKAANQLEDACEMYLQAKYMDAANKETFDKNNQLKFVLKEHGRHIHKVVSKRMDIKIDGIITLQNKSSEAIALSYLGSALRPMVDDFAQIVGTRMQTVENDKAAIQKALKKANAVFVVGHGAICTGSTQRDAEAVSMIVEKNCKAFVGASIHGIVHPINAFESKLMNVVYKLKYSKQIDK